MASMWAALPVLLAALLAGIPATSSTTSTSSTRSTRSATITSSTSRNSSSTSSSVVAAGAGAGAGEPSGWGAARATKPVLVATGDGSFLAQFPSSLNRFGSSDSLLLIAQVWSMCFALLILPHFNKSSLPETSEGWAVQGNTDAEMPKGGFGRNFASYDDGLT